MSLSTQFGLTQLIPGPDFKLWFDEQGKALASQTFRIGKNHADVALQTFMRKGQSANALNPELGTAFDFLFADKIERNDTPGGITEFFVSFSGKSWVAEFSNDSESTYSLNAALVERPIMYHPKVQSLDPAEIASLTALYKDKARCLNMDSATGPYVIVSADLSERTMQDIETTDGKLWFQKIFQRGIRTYTAPTLEWTWSASNLGGLSATYLAKLGYIDSAPRGNPPTPVGRNWMMTGATDSRTRGGDQAVSSFSVTWELSAPGTEWDEDVYTAPT